MLLYMPKASINNNTPLKTHHKFYNITMAKTTTFPLLFLSIYATLFLSISSTCTFPASPLSPPPPHNIKGMFVFGSSYVDNGNNNILNTLAKADFLPYGIDFAFGPSGRFTNGKNVVDLLGEELELPSYIPVFTNPDTKGSKIVNGVDFASGASGILDETGAIAGNVLSLSQQIKNFEEVTLVELEEQVGCMRKEALPNYLFVIGAGGNDYSLNYFPKKAANNSEFNSSVEDFTTNLTKTLSFQLQKLHDLGARKFVLISLYPIGCNPTAKASRPGTHHCVKIYNLAARLFNTQLVSLVDDMKPHMPGSTLVYVNAYKTIMASIRCPLSRGFTDAITPCCDISGTGSLCRRGGLICANRNTHVYFDGIHPTEAVNKLISKSAYCSNLSTHVYPINVMQLARI